MVLHYARNNFDDLHPKEYMFTTRFAVYKLSKSGYSYVATLRYLSTKSRRKTKKIMAVEDQFKDLEYWTLKNVKTNRRKIGNGAYGTVEEVEVGGVLCAAKRIYPVLQYLSDGQGATRTRERFVQEYGYVHHYEQTKASPHRTVLGVFFSYI